MNFRYKNKAKNISYGPSWGLIDILEKFIYTPPEKYVTTPPRGDELSFFFGVEGHFSDLYDELESYALESLKISPYTALHKTLNYIAELDLYTYLYDDLDWVENPCDFMLAMEDIFSAMQLEMPIEFKNAKDIDQLCQARDKYRSIYKIGLYTIVHSTFAILWHRKSILFQFNLLMSEKIKHLKARDYPELVLDGKMDRKSPPKWLVDAIVRREGGMCNYCSTAIFVPGMPNIVYDIDHMVPLALGGTNDPTNLVLSCSSCNNRKRAQLYSKPDQFHWPEIDDHYL